MLLANFNGKEQLRHRAVSLRQHGFLVAVGDDKKKGKERIGKEREGRKGKGRYTKSQDVIFWLFVGRTPLGRFP